MERLPLQYFCVCLMDVVRTLRGEPRVYRMSKQWLCEGKKKEKIARTTYAYISHWKHGKAWIDDVCAHRFSISRLWEFRHPTLYQDEYMYLRARWRLIQSAIACRHTAKSLVSVVIVIVLPFYVVLMLFGPSELRCQLPALRGCEEQEDTPARNGRKCRNKRL